MKTWVQEFLGGLAKMKPGTFPYARFALALLLGLLGGSLFHQSKMPLPWMMGPMVFCTVAALLRAPIAAPAVIRPPMTMVIGVMLGSSFTPSLISQIPHWWPGLLGLVGFMIACACTVVWYFRAVGGFDRTTAFFAGMPGGVVEMVTVGEEKGGDARIIALVHSVRILLIVMTLPFAIQWFEGISISRTAGAVSIFDAPLAAELWLLSCGLVGTLVGHIFRLPAKNLLGPMLVSAGIHMAGFSDFKPPFEIVSMAQLVLGVVIGCRFAGTAPALILRIMTLSLGSTAILLFWMVVFAALVSRLSGYDMETLVLAYSPGGLTEMSLIALGLHAEVAFVAAHHIVRVMLVMAAAGPSFDLVDVLRKRFGRKKAEDGTTMPAE
jgi:uncharacterized protein